MTAAQPGARVKVTTGEHEGRTGVVAEPWPGAVPSFLTISQSELVTGKPGCAIVMLDGESGTTGPRGRGGRGGTRVLVELDRLETTTERGGIGADRTGGRT